MKNLVAIALLSTAIVSGAAYAQQAQPADRTAPAATAPAANSEKMMLKNNWRASKLMGLDVYNEANEKLGDVNELILDKNGKVNAVVIGVGGFLGMGEKQHPLPWSTLKYDQRQGGYVINMDKKTLEQAPTYEGDDFLWTPEYGRKVDKYYNVPTSYWM